MDFEILKNALKEEPKYRLKQALKAVFSDFISDWSEATNLPLDLRQKLNKECPLSIAGEVQKSEDRRTIKAAIKLPDGAKIETVLIKHGDGRNTICLSSQVGCPLACVFCATGALGFKRNLSASEIVGQYLFFARYLKNSENKGQKITNAVFMGMGEPFLNYNNVMSAIKKINDKDLIGLGARHISISTSGIIEGIKKFAGEKMQINLAVSLHAPNNKLRSKLMPINKKYPLEKILPAVDGYIGKTSRRVMFEYLLIKDVNDSIWHAEELSRLMKKPLYFVNLISYNPAGKFFSAPECGGRKPAAREFMPSPPANVNKFKNILKRQGVAFTQRYSFGSDIKAACGQLAGK